MTPFEHGRGGRPSPKVLQLCAQVHDALSFALGGSTDHILPDLVLDRVEPLAGERQVLVVLHDPYGHGAVAALAALDRARGFLRNEVARFVRRRRGMRGVFFETELAPRLRDGAPAAYKDIGGGDARAARPRSRRTAAAARARLQGV